MARLTLNQVSKRFDEAVVVDRVSLEVADGEFLALLGPSGSGKTTILRMIAGFEKVTAGAIGFDGQVVSDATRHLPPERRRVGIVFQSYALWPHMTVAGNVGYPLRVARLKGEAYRRRVAAALAAVGLESFEHRRPAELSGGQRQRVALARCLVMEPSVVLLDEPLANLDVHLRAAMEEEFVAFHRKTGATMIYITHDQAEAMALADRIAVLDHGRLVQLADPRSLYREPRTAMVADFIGQGVVVDATVLGPVDGCRCGVELFGHQAVLRCAAEQAAGAAKACLRPEDLCLADHGIPAVVRRVTYKGGLNAVEASPRTTPDRSLLLALTDPPEVGSSVRVVVRDGWVIPG
jgi:iron(III) transport system ATP-binding protein